MMGRILPWEEFYVSLSQSGRAETGQVAEEDLRESAGRAEQPRTAGGKTAHTHLHTHMHTHTFNSQRSHFPSGPVDVHRRINVDIPALRLCMCVCKGVCVSLSECQSRNRPEPF